MEKSKVLDLLKSFSTSELQEFQDFVASPYFNKRRELILFLNYLLERAPKFDSEDLKKEVIFRVLFPNEPFEDKKMRYLMSYLSQLAEKYLMQKQYEFTSFRGQLDLLQSFIDRNLEKQYIQLSKKTKHTFEIEKKESESYYYNRLLFSDIEGLHFIQQLKRTYDPNIQFASDSLDCFYFLKKLRYSCSMLDRQRIIQGSYQLNFSEASIQHLKDSNFFGQDILRIYYTILKSLQEEDNKQHFNDLKVLLSQHIINIKKKDLREIYLYGINYCARKIRLGQELYVEEALNLYLEGIRQEILFDKGVLSPWTFTNVVKLALRLKRYQWIETFIRNYAPKLPEEFRENVLHYNLAELYYYTKSYEEALGQLNQVRFSDLNYHLGSRVMLAKIYYETGEENALFSLIAAFTVFLKRNKKISNDLKKTYLNFCDLLYQLLRRNSKKLPKLKQQLIETKLLTDRNWLLKVWGEIRAER